MLLPMMVELSDSHTQTFLYMIQLKLKLQLEQLLISLNSKLEMFASPPQEITLEELELSQQEKDIWEDLILFTYKMKEVHNSLQELAMSSFLVKERSHGSHYQKVTVFILHQLKPNMNMKTKTKRRNTDEKVDFLGKCSHISNVCIV